MDGEVKCRRTIDKNFLAGISEYIPVFFIRASIRAPKPRIVTDLPASVAKNIERNNQPYSIVNTNCHRFVQLLLREIEKGLEDNC